MNTLTPEQIRARRVAAFLVLADKEMASARHLLSVSAEHAAYFVQQSVEKLLRAVLENEAKPAGSTHNIRLLAEILSRQHPLHDVFIAFDSLSSASTRYRYPTEFGDVRTISAPEVETYLANLASLREAVASYLPS